MNSRLEFSFAPGEVVDFATFKTMFLRVEAEYVAQRCFGVTFDVEMTSFDSDEWRITLGTTKSRQEGAP